MDTILFLTKQNKATNLFLMRQLCATLQQSTIFDTAQSDNRHNKNRPFGK